MRTALLLALAFAMAASPAVATVACRCGEPGDARSAADEQAPARTCPCCEPGECQCCCSRSGDDAQPAPARDGVRDCGCGHAAPLQAPVADDAGVVVPPALHGTPLTESDLRAPTVRAGEQAPCARDARPPSAGFTVPLRV